MAKAKKLPSGNWRVQASKAVNKQLIKKSFTASSKKEAELLAIQWQNKKSRDITDDITLAQAYERYIASKEHVLSPNTIREYRNASKRNLQSIMQFKTGQLTQEIIQNAFNEEAKTKSPKTLRDMHGLLSAVLKLQKVDLFLDISLPQKKKPMLYIPTESEIKTILTVVKGTDMELPVILATFGPLRRGEICALTKNDINGLEVTVNKSMALNDNRKWVIKPPKTYAGYRTVKMPLLAKPLLDNVKDKVTDYSPNAITKHFHEILVDNNLPVFRFHDLRHYCVSYLHFINIPIKYIMARGGWSTEAVVNNIYNHILIDKNEEMNKKINDAFDSFI